jgi:hypothetical protein
MSMISAIAAEHDRKIVTTEINRVKAEVTKDLTQAEVLELLTQLEKAINSQIDE